MKSIPDFASLHPGYEITLTQVLGDGRSTDDHAFIAAQIHSALDSFTLPVEER